MRILFVTDAWHPQVNGVVRTIEETRSELVRRGHSVEIIGPDRFRTVPLPTYSDIKLALPSHRKISALMDSLVPDRIHIATEGPLGWRARAWCLRNGVRFTTAYHSRFPEYLAARLPVPTHFTYGVLRRFHAPSYAIMVSTQSITDDLTQRGFRKIVPWTRGVDTELFRPLPGAFADLPRPILLYAGRLAVEKNLAAFLALETEGSKLVVGDGPQFDHLQRDFPGLHFTGRLAGDDLARAYSAADVFVFPSLTDTFGLVLAEAMACGTPVAAYDVAGPRDVLAPQDRRAPVGVLGDNLQQAVDECLALKIPAQRCRDFVIQHYSWAIATDQFLASYSPTCNQMLA